MCVCVCVCVCVCNSLYNKNIRIPRLRQGRNKNYLRNMLKLIFQQT